MIRKTFIFSGVHTDEHVNIFVSSSAWTRHAHKNSHAYASHMTCVDIPKYQLFGTNALSHDDGTI